MTTIRITLPDDLARQAQAAGLLVPETLTAMLRERLRRQDAGERLRALLAQMPRDELTPEIEQEIVAEVRAYRAEQRQQAGR